MTRFDNFIKGLSIEDFSKMVVKAVVVNNMDLYYLTSSGQLYPYNTNGYNQALKHEIMFWSQEISTDTGSANPTNDANE